MKNSIKTVFFFAIAVFSSCAKDKPLTPTGSGVTITSGSGAFILDEGNYGGGNAMLSYFNFADAITQEDLFRPKNLRPLGDVGQSMTLINGNYFIVVNNSGKIEVVNPTTGLSSKTITGFTSPRYILPVSPTKAYVSDLFANAISIVDLTTETKTSSFAFPGESEAMTIYNGEVFVTSTDHDKVFVIDPTTNAITDSIQVAKGGNSLQIDNNGKLWVLCYGDYFTSAPGGLYRINTSTHAVEVSLPFTTTESPTRLCANSTGDTLYYLDYDLERIASTASSLPSSAFIPAGGHSFYGLGIRPQSGEIFVTDAIDYSQRGHILQYSAAGVLMNDAVVGVIPGTVYFY